MLKEIKLAADQYQALYLVHKCFPFILRFLLERAFLQIKVFLKFVIFGYFVVCSFKN